MIVNSVEVPESKFYQDVERRLYEIEITKLLSAYSSPPVG